jgi:hypothetical protein
MDAPTARGIGVCCAAWFCLLLAGAGLAGCATGGAPSQGVKWFLEKEAEKKRLDDAGFPQYTGAV